MKIDKKEIGLNQPTFIIAEIGINHNGDIEIAKKLIDVAKEAGCDAVKFQKRTPELCVPKDQRNKPKETPWGDMTYLEYKKRMEFGAKEFQEIQNYCDDKEMIWFASPWDIPSVEFLEGFGVPCYKIASASLADEKLLERIKDTGKPVLLSTGMSTMEEIDKAVNILGKDNLVLLHCNSSYPCKSEEINLKVMQTLKYRYEVLVGYSGHEEGVFPAPAAVMLGADVIEKHITLDRSMWGTDQAASIEPQGLKTIIRDVRRAEIILGDGVKKVYESEMPIREKLRK